MSVFVIADISVTNPEWVNTYAVEVPELIARHGGKYLSRSGNITRLEGDHPDSTLIAIIQFPDSKSFEAFANDPDYLPYATSRQKGSVSRLTLIDDTDAAGVISYLAKP